MFFTVVHANYFDNLNPAYSPHLLFEPCVNLVFLFVYYIQGDPKLAPPSGRRSGMTWCLSDQSSLKYNLFKYYLPILVFWNAFFTER